MVVGAVVDGGEQVVGLNEADGEPGTGAQVKAAAEVGSKGRTGVGRAWIRPLDNGPAGVGDSD